MERTCELTGKPFTGLGLVLNTTDGQLVVSPAGLHQLLADSADQAAADGHAPAAADGDTPPAEPQP